MKNIPWKITAKRRTVAEGSLEAADDRAALEALLGGEAEGFEPKPDECYSIEAGELVTSAYGDEFARVARTMTGLDDVAERLGQRTAGGYMHEFGEGSVPIDEDNLWDPGHPMCRTCVEDGTGHCQGCGRDLRPADSTPPICPVGAAHGILECKPGPVVGRCVACNRDMGGPTVSVTGLPVFDTEGNDLTTELGGINWRAGLTVERYGKRYQVISVDENRAIVERRRGAQISIEINLSDEFRKAQENIERMRKAFERSLGVPRRML